MIQMYKVLSGWQKCHTNCGMDVRTMNWTAVLQPM